MRLCRRTCSRVTPVRTGPAWTMVEFSALLSQDTSCVPPLPPPPPSLLISAPTVFCPLFGTPSLSLFPPSPLRLLATPPIFFRPRSRTTSCMSAKTKQNKKLSRERTREGRAAFNTPSVAGRMSLASSRFSRRRATSRGGWRTPYATPPPALPPRLVSRAVAFLLRKMDAPTARARRVPTAARRGWREGTAKRREFATRWRVAQEGAKRARRVVKRPRGYGAKD